MGVHLSFTAEAYCDYVHLELKYFLGLEFQNK